MTYSQTTFLTPLSSASTLTATHPALISGARSAKMWAVVAAGVMWMFTVCSRAQSRGHAQQIQRAQLFQAVIKLLSIIMTMLPGSQAEKMARLKLIFGKANARMAALRRRYAIWRQRKCWLWGGGFMNAQLTTLTASTKSARRLHIVRRHHS